MENKNLETDNKDVKKKPSKALIIGIVLAVLIAVVAIVCIALGKKNNESVYRLVKVKSFSGDVVLARKSDGTSPAIFEGLQLVTEDQVTVNEEALVELLVDSDKHIAAKSNTCFSINASGSEEAGSVKIDLLYGESLFIIDNKLPDGSTFEVTTHNVTLSVRGTKFNVIYDPNKEETTVEVFDGVVVVVSNGEEYVLEAGDKKVFGKENVDDELVNENAALENNTTDSAENDAEEIAKANDLEDNTDENIDEDTEEDTEEIAEEDKKEDKKDEKVEDNEKVKEEVKEEVVEEATLSEATLKGDWLFYHFEDEYGITDNIMVFNGDGTGWYVTRIWGPSYETGEMTDMTWANPVTYSINGNVVNIKEDWGSRIDEYSLNVNNISGSKMVGTGDGALGGQKTYTKINDLGRSWVH